MSQEVQRHKGSGKLDLGSHPGCIMATIKKSYTETDRQGFSEEMRQGAEMGEELGF